MPTNLTEVSQWTTNVPVPDDGDNGNVASVIQFAQVLADRTKWLREFITSAALTKTVELPFYFDQEGTKGWAGNAFAIRTHTANVNASRYATALLLPRRGTLTTLTVTIDPETVVRPVTMPEFRLYRCPFSNVANSVDPDVAGMTLLKSVTDTSASDGVYAAAHDLSLTAINYDLSSNADNFLWCVFFNGYDTVPATDPEIGMNVYNLRAVVTTA